MVALLALEDDRASGGHVRALHVVGELRQQPREAPGRARCGRARDGGRSEAHRPYCADHGRAGRVEALSALRLHGDRAWRRARRNARNATSRLRELEANRERRLPRRRGARPCSRDAGSSPSKGKWDLPGGSSRRRSIRSTAAPRASRGGGVEVEPLEFLGVWIDKYGGDGSAQSTLNHYWTARIVDGTLEAADDVAEFRWFAPDEVPLEEIAFPHTREVLSGPAGQARVARGLNPRIWERVPRSSGSPSTAATQPPGRASTVNCSPACSSQVPAASRAPRTGGGCPRRGARALPPRAGPGCSGCSRRERPAPQPGDRRSWRRVARAWRSRIPSARRRANALGGADDSPRRCTSRA